MKRALFSATNLKLLIVVLVFTIISYWIYFSYNLSGKDFSTAIFSAFISGIFVSAIFSIISTIQARDEISAGLASILVGDADVLEHFTPAARSKVVESALVSNFGSDFGEGIYQNLLTRLFDGTSDVYSFFDYQIDIFDLHDDRVGGSEAQNNFISSLEKDRFIWTRTKFSFQLQLSRLERHLFNKQIMVAICFSSKSLNSLTDQTSRSREKKFVQREVLFLDSAALTELFSSPYGKPQIFASEVLGVKCRQVQSTKEASLREIYFDTRWADVGAEKYLEIELHLTWGELEKKAVEVEISFPSLKDDKLFFALMPRPTKEPTITFNNFISDITEHQEVTSVSSSKAITSDSTPLNGAKSSVQIKFSEWVFPTSGIVFFWK